MEHSERVLNYMAEHNETPYKVAKATGISESTFSKWKFKPTSDIIYSNVQKMATYFNISVNELLGEDVHKATEQILPVGGLVPVVGTVPAGLPILAVENIVGYEYAGVKDSENYFYLIVKGNSMINAGIKDGCKVLVRKQNTAESGQIVACRVNGDEATLKRFRQQGDTVILMPENSDFVPIVVSCEDFNNGFAEILGVAKKILTDL